MIPGVERRLFAKVFKSVGSKRTKKDLRSVQPIQNFKLFTAPGNSGVSEQARAQVNQLQKTFNQWDCNRETFEPILDQVEKLGIQVQQENNLASKEFIYQALARCVENHGAKVNQRRSFFLRMFLQQHNLANFWDIFEEDFDTMFKQCHEEKGLGHALEFFKMFSQTAPILSQNQYSRVLAQLPQAILETP